MYNLAKDYKNLKVSVKNILLGVKSLYVLKWLVIIIMVDIKVNFEL